MAEEFQVTDGHVGDAMDWLRGHPSNDYLDAATEIAWRHFGASDGSNALGRAAWPEFIDRVRDAATASAEVQTESKPKRGRRR